MGRSRCRRTECTDGARGGGSRPGSPSRRGWTDSYSYRGWTEGCAHRPVLQSLASNGSLRLILLTRLRLAAKKRMVELVIRAEIHRRKRNVHKRSWRGRWHAQAHGPDTGKSGHSFGWVGNAVRPVWDVGAIAGGGRCIFELKVVVVVRRDGHLYIDVGLENAVKAHLRIVMEQRRRLQARTRAAARTLSTGEWSGGGFRYIVVEPQLWSGSAEVVARPGCLSGAVGSRGLNAKGVRGSTSLLRLGVLAHYILE